jgi:hypothetical protein
MSPIKGKVKGSAFERQAVELLNLNLKGGTFRKIAGSGAIGTSMDEPLLTGDITGKIDGFPLRLKGECKVGYGGAKSLTLQKEWIDKIKREAVALHAFPFLMCKFSGAKKADGVQEFVVLDLEEFVYIFNFITDLKLEIDKIIMREEKEENEQL